MKKNIQNALRQVAEDVADLLDDGADSIADAAQAQFGAQAREDSDKPLTFGLAISAKLVPATGGQMAVKTTISWNVREKRETESVTTDNELPLFKNQTAEGLGKGDGE